MTAKQGGMTVADRYRVLTADRITAEAAYTGRPLEDAFVKDGATGAVFCCLAGSPAALAELVRLANLGAAAESWRDRPPLS